MCWTPGFRQGCGASCSSLTAPIATPVRQLTASVLRSSLALAWLHCCVHPPPLLPSPKLTMVIPHRQAIQHAGVAG